MTIQKMPTVKTPESKSGEKRVLAAVFVVERDGSDHVEDPQGNVIDETTLSQKHQNAIRHQRAVKPDGHRWRIFLYDYVY